MQENINNKLINLFINILLKTVSWVNTKMNINVKSVLNLIQLI